MQVKGKFFGAAVLASATAVLGAGSAAAVAPIEWQSCETLFGLQPGSIPEDVHMQCAQVDVPLNYSDPNGRTTKVGVSKISAKSGNPKSTIFGNPGGPGADALSYWMPSPMGGNPEGLYNDYDLVGVQPRGLFGSNPIDCNPAAVSPVSINHLHDACYGTDAAYLASMTTENAARDIDTVRQAMGLAQIDFEGVSYGTKVGADYATLYPQNVSRLVLDSNVNPHWTWAEQSAQTTEARRARVYDMFQWIADHDAEYGLGDTPLKVYYNWKAIADQEVGGTPNLIPPAAVANDLPAEFRDTPLQQPALDVINSSAPARARAEGLWNAVMLREVLNTGATGIVDTTVGATANEQSWPMVANILRYYNRGGTIPRVDLQGAARVRSAREAGPALNTQAGMFQIVTCNENSTPTDPFAAVAAKVDAHTGGDVLLTQAAGERAGADCLGYQPVARPIQVNGDALAQKPLVLNNLQDAITPVAGADAMTRAMGGDFRGVPNGGHGVFRSGNRVVDDAVLAFFANGTLPALELPGRPAPQPLPTTLEGEYPAHQNYSVQADAGHQTQAVDDWYGTQGVGDFPMRDAAAGLGTDAAGAGGAAAANGNSAAANGNSAGQGGGNVAADPVRDAANRAAQQLDQANTSLSGVQQSGAQTLLKQLLGR